MRKKNTRKGFTIVELVIVIAVIGILAAVLIPTFGNVIENANESAALQEARNKLTEYMIDNATNPKDGIIYVDGYYFGVKGGTLLLDANGDVIISKGSVSDALNTAIPAEDGKVWTKPTTGNGFCTETTPTP